MLRFKSIRVSKRGTRVLHLYPSGSRYCYGESHLIWVPLKQSLRILGNKSHWFTRNNPIHYQDYIKTKHNKLCLMSLPYMAISQVYWCILNHTLGIRFLVELKWNTKEWTITKPMLSYCTVNVNWKLLLCISCCLSRYFCGYCGYSVYINSFVQGCGNSRGLTIELPSSCAEPYFRHRNVFSL